METYSQRDCRWAGMQIGESRLTMGRFGCLITGIAMLTTHFKPDRTPAEMLTRLRFTPGGLVIWASARFENFAFRKREHSRNDTEIAKHLKHPDLAVILQVATYSHWVVATGIQPASGLVNIADPWLGDRASMARYKNDITGAVYFERRKSA